MGIDFIAYSNVRTEPVLEKYRNKKGKVDIECFEIYEKDPDFITICETKQIAYFKTSDTIKGSTGRGYSGFSEFCNEIQKLSGESLIINYEYIMLNDYCDNIINTLEKARKFFVSTDWKPDYKLYSSKTRFDESIVINPNDDIHDESWFFREFYTTVYVAKNNGILWCSW
jgi:hypothetical protein